jgi:hypothetical protein
MNDSSGSSERADSAAAGVATPTAPASRFRLWFGLFGGAVAWTIHFLAAYAIAEFGCVSSFRDARFLGITGVAWGILAITALTLVLAVGALLIARRSERLLLAETREKEDEPEDFMVRVGLITSVVFVAIIVAQTLPVLYYLRSC